MALGPGVELVRRAHFDIALQHRIAESRLAVGLVAFAAFELPEELVDSVRCPVRVEDVDHRYRGTTVELGILDEDLRHRVAAVRGLMRYGILHGITPPEVLSVTRFNNHTLLPGKGCLTENGDGLGASEQQCLRTRIGDNPPNFARYMKSVRLPGNN